jgi:hypothetical protein
MSDILELKLVRDLEKPNPDDKVYTPNLDVQMMADALTKKVRGYKTAPKSWESIWVYRPQDTYAMGWVRYADVFEGGTGDKRHAVYSPNIQNGKYSYGDNCFMSSALHFNKGLLNACKYLRPPTAKQALQQVQRDFARGVSRSLDEVKTKAQKITNKIDTDVFGRTRLNTAPLKRELANILKSDYEFLDKELEVQLTEAFEAVKELHDGRDIHDRDHTFIEVIQAQGANLYRGFNRVSQSYSLFRHDDSAENKIVYTQEELPENLLGAMSVLSMVEEDQYVAGVGYRAGANMFYIKGE